MCNIIVLRYNQVFNNNSAQHKVVIVIINAHTVC